VDLIRSDRRRVARQERSSRLVANRTTPDRLGPHITADPDRAAMVLAAASTLALDFKRSPRGRPARLWSSA
jgi:hypothetical protein